MSIIIVWENKRPQRRVQLVLELPGPGTVTCSAVRSSRHRVARVWFLRHRRSRGPEDARCQRCSRLH